MSAQSQTHYDLLEVPANAPVERIKESYHVLASVWHPDRFPQGSTQHRLATRKLREMNAAYEVLKDPRRRAEYDRQLIEERRVSGVYWKLRASGNYGPPTSLPNLPALVAYALGPIAVVFLLTPRYRAERFVCFSVWQSILFSLTAYVGILIGPRMGLDRPIYWVLWMTVVTLYWIFLMKQAYHNRLYLIPGLGRVAARRAGVNEAHVSELKAGESH